MYRGIIFGNAAFILFIAAAFSATIYVPDNYASIQGAIDASSNGDTVIVRPGTYVENIDFVGKAITVQSESGPEVTTIDGSQGGREVTFYGGEGPDSILDGFTLTGGSGGVVCKYSSSPTIRNNIIRQNATLTSGGGIYCGSGCSPIITNNTISGNTAVDYGGGIYCGSYCRSIITKNIVSENAAHFLGGGIYCDRASPTIVKNLVQANTGYDWGGGIYSDWGSGGLIANNVILENIAAGITDGWGRGAGICCYASNPSILNNQISMNMGYGTGSCGGGIYIHSCSPTISNNTIVGNTTEASSGGIYVRESSVTVTNMILWDNQAPFGPEIYLSSYHGSSTLNISYSDLKGGQTSVHVESGSTLNWGSGMIDADPLFVDPANGDFHLTCLSPCYGAGDNNAPGLPSIDMEGDPRVIHDTVEIGADEFFCHLYYVGSPIPGETVNVRVAAIPGQDVTLYRGDEVLETPYWTGHGYLYITWPAAAAWYLGKIPQTGVLTLEVTIPVNWVPGDKYFFQAQVGQWGNTYSWLTNYEALIVE